MKNQICSSILILRLSCFLVLATLTAEAEVYAVPSGTSEGNREGNTTLKMTLECCEEGKFYKTYTCLMQVTSRTKAVLTLNGFGKVKMAGESSCHNRYHSNNEHVVALWTGWFNDRKRCMKYIKIHGNERTVRATVVDECDSTMGCDRKHDFQPPCPHNHVDASAAVWRALGMPKSNWGELEIYWSD